MRRDRAMVAMKLREGQPLTADHIEPPPVPMQGFYVAAYYDLETERPNNGWSICAIPRSKIVAYGRERGLGGEVLDAFVYVLRRMDAAALDWERAEEAKRNPPKP